MFSEDDWESIEDSCPENRELADLARELGGIYESCSQIDWQKSRLRCAEVFQKLFLGCPKSQALAERFDGENVRISEGVPALFDVIASVASDDVLTWAEKLSLT